MPRPVISSLVTDFYPRPPRGGRLPSAATRPFHQDFYPRPPRGGRRWGRWCPVRKPCISIHALREEGDRERCEEERTMPISIHALREEGDHKLTGAHSCGH